MLSRFQTLSTFFGYKVTIRTNPEITNMRFQTLTIFALSVLAGAKPLERRDQCIAGSLLCCNSAEQVTYNHCPNVSIGLT